MRRRRRGRSELDVIVLARAFDEHAPLQRVIGNDLRGVVGPGVHEARPGAGIGAFLHRAEAIDPETGELLVVPLGAWKYVWIVDSVGAALALRAAARIEVDGAEAVGIDREREFIQQRWRKRA